MDRQIVVCDDEPHVVRAISLKFTRAGFEVKGVSDPESCWRLLHGHEPQQLLILGDAISSGEKVLELVRRIRGDASLAELPIVLLTSNNLAPLDSELAKLKIDKLISMPFSPRALLVTVCELLDQEMKTGGSNADGNRVPKFTDRNRLSSRPT